SLQAVDRPDLAARATIVGVVLNLVLNIVLVWEFGITGAAVATMVASLISGLLLHSYYLSRLVSIHIPYRELVGCVLASTTMGLILLLVRRWVTVNTIVELAFIVLVGVATYGISLFALPSFRRKLANHL
ncbi:MAG: polysaccharide biosynthesis C-terminal domain-containing protein, partial [Halobacteriaceae archaeon]